MGWTPLRGKALASIGGQSVIDQIQHPLASPVGNGLLLCADVRHDLEKTTTHTPANLFVQYDGGVG